MAASSLRCCEKTEERRPGPKARKEIGPGQAGEPGRRGPGGVTPPGPRLTPPLRFPGLRRCNRRARLELGHSPAGTGRSHNAMPVRRSEEHTSELQSLIRNSYAVFCLKKKITRLTINHY